LNPADQNLPKKPFRVVACDTFEGPSADYEVGTFDELDIAIAAAKAELCPMLAVYVYDGEGVLKFHEFMPGGFS
jgi:hypothetical protein